MPVIQIKEFPNDGRVWRIDWFGAVRKNDNVPTEPTIDVYLRPVSVTDKTSIADFGWLNKERICCTIGVGQLPVLTIGSLWKNGKLLDYKVIVPSNLPNVNIAEDSVRLIEAAHKDQTGYIINKAAFDIGGFKNGLSARCLAIESDGDPYSIIIPVAEVIRFYYAISTNLAKIAFLGSYETNFDQIIGERCGFDSKTKILIIHLRQWLYDNEGWVLGRILRDKNAQQGFFQIHRSLVKQSVGKYHQPMPETNFPFQGKTDWAARCLSFTSGGKVRTLILELLRCTAPFPFSNLVVIRDNDGRQASPETDLPESNKRPYLRNQRLKSGTSKKLHSIEEPVQNMKRMVIDYVKERFGDLWNKELIKPEKEFCNYRKTDLLFLPPSESTTALGTGDGTSGQSKTAPISISINVGKETDIAQKPRSHSRSEALPATFENMMAAVRYLSENYQDKGVTAKVWPTLYMPLTSNRSSQWSYLDTSATTTNLVKTPRRVLIAELNIDNMLFWLVEFEQRESESLTAAMIYGASSMKAEEIKKILHLLARSKGIWKNIPPHGRFHIRPMKHSWPSIEEYASSIYKACLATST
ncbi:hypothetical protein LST1_14920 [Neisseria elongata]|jgi:hypothetical protein|uniref:hypothetical protein n=3 Tax=Neisseria elongata TaxID=495 RepID=UPI002852DBBA|nr:hypothetical protein LST1_14920 [Neisseria elongata]